MASTSSTTTTTVTHPDGTVIETTTTTSEGAPEAPAPVTAASLAACADPPLPTDKLLQAPPPERQPVVIVSCGSFSPPTLLHLRIFEDAKVHLQSTGKYTVVGGYLSPVHAAYGKKSLADMHHRINMAEVCPLPSHCHRHPPSAASPRPAALRPAPPHSSRPPAGSRAARCCAQMAVRDSDWLMVDAWECAQTEWTRTAVALQTIGKRLPDFGGRRAKVMLVQPPLPPSRALPEIRSGADLAERRWQLCGGDLLESFPVIKDDGEPLWAPDDQRIILAENGVACLERAGTDLAAVIQQHSILHNNEHNIEVIPQAAANSISSTVVRRQLTSGGSVKYLMPDACADYVREHQLDKLPQWQ